MYEWLYCHIPNIEYAKIMGCFPWFGTLSNSTWSESVLKRAIGSRFTRHRATFSCRPRLSIDSAWHRLRASKANSYNCIIIYPFSCKLMTKTFSRSLMVTLMATFWYFLSCPSLNPLFRAHNQMDSHMLTWALNIENCQVCHSWHPYHTKHILFKRLRLAHQADWGIRPQNSSTKMSTSLGHCCTSTKLSDSFGKNRDALISWYIMRLRGPAIPVAPLFSAGCKQHELKGKQCRHECNIRRIWLNCSCCTKSTARMFPFQTAQNHT